jgi:hypothetical protein
VQILHVQHDHRRRDTGVEQQNKARSDEQLHRTDMLPHAARRRRKNSGPATASSPRHPGSGRPRRDGRPPPLRAYVPSYFINSPSVGAIASAQIW